jgi:hypothetical protein
MIIQIADALVAELNAGTFSQTFTAERAYVPRFNLEEMAELRVTVVPKGVEITGGTRAKSVHDYRIDIGVQKKLDSDDLAGVDALMAFVEEIADYLRFRRLEGAPEAHWLGIENGPIYVTGHLHEMRLFTSVLTVTYRVMR